jgi:CheY-like chemotaxis protein
VDHHNREMRQERDLDDRSRPSTRRRLKILLVEDNETYVWLFCQAFEALRIDHDLEVERDGEEALERLVGPGRVDPLPDIVLLDMNIPRVGGFQVLIAVRADPNLRSLPVIILSSSRAQKDVKRAYELGANSYIYKSFSDFSDLVGDFARYWLHRSEIPPQRGG